MTLERTQARLGQTHMKIKMIDPTGSTGGTHHTCYSLRAIDLDIDLPHNRSLKLEALSSSVQEIGHVGLRP